jgi:phospholipid N-methyltransferase
MDSSEAEQIYPPQFRQFFRSWIQDPLTVGAVVPSGRTLAKLMVRGLHSGARVMELGAGTGTVTRAILDRGVAQSDLCLVERNASFARLLKQRFPNATLLEEDATSLVDSARQPSGSFDFIVSGLPLVLF